MEGESSAQGGNNVDLFGIDAGATEAGTGAGAQNPTAGVQPAPEGVSTVDALYRLLNNDVRRLEEKSMHVSNFTVHAPPKLTSEDEFYDWTTRFKTFLNVHDYMMYPCLLTTPPAPVVLGHEGRLRPKTPQEMSSEERHLFQANQKALGYLHSALDREFFSDVRTCETPKEIWDMLHKRMEGSEDRRDNRLTRLMKLFDDFCATSETEPLNEMHRRFTRLLLELKTFGKVYTQKEVNNKFLQAAPIKFYVTAASIKTHPDWKRIPLDDIVGKLESHEVCYSGHPHEQKVAKLEQSLVLLTASDLPYSVGVSPSTSTPRLPAPAEVSRCPAPPTMSRPPPPHHSDSE